MEMMLLVMVSSWGTAVVRVSTTPLRAPLIRSLKVERFRFPDEGGEEGESHSWFEPFCTLSM